MYISIGLYHMADLQNLYIMVYLNLEIWCILKLRKVIQGINDLQERNIVVGYERWVHTAVQKVS